MIVREAFNTWSHAVGAVVSLYFCYLFIFILLTEAQPVFLLCYYMALALLLCLVPALFIMGSMGQKDQIQRLRMIDHMMIYVVIAGGYTPIAVLTLSDDMGAIVLTGIWIIAGLGILKKEPLDECSLLVFYSALYTNGLGFGVYYSDYLERNNSIF